VIATHVFNDHESTGKMDDDENDQGWFNPPGFTEPADVLGHTAYHVLTWRRIVRWPRIARSIPENFYVQRED
jgi:hypothetical protein